MQRIVENDIALKREQQDQGNDQAHGRDRSNALHKNVVVPLGTALGDKGFPREVACCQGNDDVEHYRQQDRIPGHLNIRDAQQQDHDRRKGKQHNQVIERHLH